MIRDAMSSRNVYLACLLTMSDRSEYVVIRLLFFWEAQTSRQELPLHRNIAHAASSTGRRVGDGAMREMPSQSKPLEKFYRVQARTSSFKLQVQSPRLFLTPANEMVANFDTRGFIKFPSRSSPPAAPLRVTKNQGVRKIVE